MISHKWSDLPSRMNTTELRRDTQAHMRSLRTLADRVGRSVGNRGSLPPRAYFAQVSAAARIQPGRFVMT